MFSFTTNPTISITLDGQQSRMRKTIKVQGGDPIELPIYSGQENICGSVDISMPPGKKIEHQGVRIEMIGQTGLCDELSLSLFQIDKLTLTDLIPRN